MDKSGKGKVLIKRDIYEELIRQCLKDPAREVCGILAGRDKIIEKIFPLANISDSPKLCYHIDPKEQLAVFKQLRNQGLELSAIYHSHVDSPAYPSAKDIELAFYPESSYIIVSLFDPESPVARSFRIVEGKIEEEELVCID
ncbi:MAG TPA: M67 family metallopeptidase [Candidatus Omnitrophota bacterium]|nr:M67 family metallopeptidase [Candidatus Omnitrophota bacterium]